MKLVKRTEIEKPKQVYNLRARNNHNYIANDVVVSNCHTAKSLSIQKIAKKCTNAEYRIGFTGTVPSVQADQLNIYGYLGPRIFDLRTKTLIDKGVLSQISIGNIIIEYDPITRRTVKNASYPEEVKFLVNYTPRNRVLDYIISTFERGENALILCQRIEHLKNIKTYLEAHHPFYDVEVIYKKVKAKDREAIRVGVEDRGNVIIIGTYATMSTGINIKNLHHVVFAASYKSKIKILQSIGRGLRKHASKEQVILWDIIDDLSWIGPRGGVHKNHVLKHFDQRVQYYQEQGFQFFNRRMQLQKINSSDQL